MAYDSQVHEVYVNSAKGPMTPSFPELEKYQPTLHQTILDVEQQIKSPHTLILSSLLATLSLACQPKVDVTHPTGQTSPVSLYLLSLAVSGERKTATDSALMQEITQAQRAFNKAQERAEAEHTEAMVRWELLKKFYTKQLAKIWAKKAANGDLARRPDVNTHETGQSEVFDEEKALTLALQKHHLEDKPSLSKSIKLQIENVTPSAFLKFFDRYYPSTGIIADEGAGALMSFAAANIGNLNNSWNGKTIHVERSSTDSFTVDNPRLTVHLMLQPELFQNSLKQKNNFWVESGLVARALFSFPTSKIGYRPVAPSSIISDDSRPGKAEFHARIRTIIDRAYGTEKPWAKQAIGFDPGAATEWKEYLNEVEVAVRPEGKYAKIAAAASKSAENVARVAALLQCYENFDRETVHKISQKNVLVAKEIVSYYLDQQLSYFAPPFRHEGEKYAQLFYTWFDRRARMNPILLRRGMSTRQIAKLANPRFLRAVKIHGPVLEFLEEQGYIDVLEHQGEEHVFLTGWSGTWTPAGMPTGLI